MKAFDEFITESQATPVNANLVECFVVKSKHKAGSNLFGAIDKSQF